MVSISSPSSNDTSPVPLSPERRKAVARQIGDVKPATNALVGSFAESVANVRNHEHPSWEDLYCMNLTSYMGERMAPVLRRLLDTEAENARLRAELVPYEVLNPQQCPAGVHADWLVDSEHTHACPWCEVDRLRARVDELEALKPARFQDCQVCGAGYEYGQPCTQCQFKKLMAEGPDALPRDLSPELARRIEQNQPETNTSHECNLPLSRRLDCGHCPHEVCQDCERCPHTCRCASPEPQFPTCIRCGATAGPLKPTGDRYPSDAQKFECSADCTEATS